MDPIGLYFISQRVFRVLHFFSKQRLIWSRERHGIRRYYLPLWSLASRREWSAPIVFNQGKTPFSNGYISRTMWLRHLNWIKLGHILWELNSRPFFEQVTPSMSPGTKHAMSHTIQFSIWSSARICIYYFHLTVWVYPYSQERTLPGHPSTDTSAIQHQIQCTQIVISTRHSPVKWRLRNVCCSFCNWWKSLITIFL